MALTLDALKDIKKNRPKPKSKVSGQFKKDKVLMPWEYDEKPQNIATPEKEKDSKLTVSDTQKIQKRGATLKKPELIFLGGQNRTLLEIFFQDCKNHNSLTSSYWKQEQLAGKIGIKNITVRTLVHRLVKSGYILRLQGKVGRGGAIKIRIPKYVFDQLKHLELQEGN